jgi:hypothetical protein
VRELFIDSRWTLGRLLKKVMRTPRGDNAKKNEGTTRTFVFGRTQTPRPRQAARHRSAAHGEGDEVQFPHDGGIIRHWKLEVAPLWPGHARFVAPSGPCLPRQAIGRLPARVAPERSQADCPADTATARIPRTALLGSADRHWPGYRAGAGQRRRRGPADGPASIKPGCRRSCAPDLVRVASIAIGGVCPGREA